MIHTVKNMVQNIKHLQLVMMLIRVVAIMVQKATKEKV